MGWLRRWCCGWTPWTPHLTRPGRYLSVIGEEICQICDQHLLVHKDYPGAIPWNDRIEADFRELQGMFGSREP